jgi:hypothetical protein
MKRLNQLGRRTTAAMAVLIALAAVLVMVGR